MPALLFVFTALPLTAQESIDQPCGQDPSCYAKRDYTVGKISFETLFGRKTPLSFIFAVQKLLLKQFAKIKPELALQEGQKFTVGGYTSSQLKVAEILGAPENGEKFKLVVVTPSLKDNGGSTVDITYRVFTTEGLSFVTARAERRNDRTSREILIPVPGSDKNKFLPQPFVGYNRSRGLYGGTSGSFKTTGRVINEVDLDVSGSGSSAAVDVALKGAKTFDEGVINYAEWKLGYSYSNIPTDAVRLKESTLRAQFFGGTRPLGARGMALRFGASVEGGNRQTDFTTNPAVIPFDLRNSPYGAVKLYLGTTMNWGRQAFKASYGLQLGQGGKKVRADYVKQIVDANYSVRFLPREHLPLRLDVRSSAGLITSSSGRIPVAERFFGGNVSRNFIQGADWEINSSPIIRSFPQNSLNLVENGLPIGGKSFFSANFTLSQTVWYIPAVEREISHDPELRIKLSGAITTERENAKGSYLYLSPAFKEVIKDLDDLGGVFTKLGTALGKARCPGQETGCPTPESDCRASEAICQATALFYDIDENSGFKPLPDAIEALNEAKADKTVTLDKVTSLAVDVPEIEFDSYITVLVKLIEKITSSGVPVAGLAETVEPLKSIQKALQQKRGEINSLQNYNPEDIGQVAEKVNELTPILEGLQGKLAQLPVPAANDPAEEYASKLEAFSRYLEAAQNGISDVNANEINTRDAERLAIGYGKVAPALLTGLINSIRELRAPMQAKGLSPEWQALEAETEKLKTLQSQIIDRLKKTGVPEIEKRANRDIAFTGRTLDVIFRELNIVSVSPLLMFDVARLGPQVNPAFNKFRYGLGGGVRFSLVSLDIDVGYSWNPNRRPTESRGAFVFSLNVSDFFR